MTDNATITEQRLRLARHRGQLTDPQSLAAAAQILVVVDTLLDLAYAVTTGTGGPLLVPLARLQLPGLLTAGVVFLIWFWRCHTNIRALAPERLTFSPGTAVVVWFVPIVCLWQPRQAIMDLARATGGVSTRLVNAWWAAWLTQLLGRPALTFAFGLAGYRGSATPWLALADTAAAALVIPMIRQITAAQRALIHAR
ncbi:hypothetical protein C7C46_20565 [Streptomyces tateyamensis]|uniref:DUF4328 domain-containing protein n=1 Tax=Streptomyces tateyamensis TaxID=565073 RepID=A0A2V4NMS3_9ACTN|nr:DUF4328 domain-containing protein [Streptomyces tateyamensis]PYC76996.1 hypothetical protein C7C46_20565 [Streptomyces tateyamensis]